MLVGDEDCGIAIGAGFFGSAIAGLSVAEFAVPLLLPSTRAAGSVVELLAGVDVELEAPEADWSAGCEVADEPLLAVAAPIPESAEDAEALPVEQVDAMSDALCRLISLPETVPFTETV